MRKSQLVLRAKSVAQQAAKTASGRLSYPVIKHYAPYAMPSAGRMPALPDRLPAGSDAFTCMAGLN